MTYNDKFGFLNIGRSFSFEGGVVTILENFEASRSWIDECTNRDGYLYPPQVETVEIYPKKLEEIRGIPKTQRPALTHKLPASHEIELQEGYADGDVRNGDGGLIVHLLGYIFGTRLQFYDWWHDGRVPIKSTHNINV